MAIDQKKLEDLLHRSVVDFGAVFNAAMVAIGDELGLYKAMTGAGPMSSAQLAEKTGFSERYLREWLCQQAAGGYIDYDKNKNTFTLSEEASFAFSNEDGPVFLPGAFQIALASIKAKDQIAERFRTGKGFGWHEHDPDVFCGTNRFFKPGYTAHLIQEWIPSLNGVEEKLKNGGLVADVGCGLGTSTILMAKAFPNSRFIAFDYHDHSLELARKAAATAGVGDRIRFEVAKAKDFPKKGNGYDLVTFFDSLHDMGDPVGAAKHVLETLAKDGTWMVVEPMAGDNIGDNMHPLGRAYYGASSLLCTPGSLSQEVGLALGAQAGEAKLREVIIKGGFSKVRRTAETPFNIILEAKL